MTTSDQVQDEYEVNTKITPVKFMLDQELNKSSNSEDDDVFISSSVSPNNNDLVDHLNGVTINEPEDDTKNITENLDETPTTNKNNVSKNELYSLKRLHNIITTDRKYQFKDIHIENDLHD